MKCLCAVTSQGSGGPVLPSYATAPCLPPGEPPSSWSVWTQHERVFRGKGSQAAMERMEEFCLFIRNNSISGIRWWKMRSPGGCSGWNCSRSPSLFCLFSGIWCLVFWFGWLGWAVNLNLWWSDGPSQSEEDHRIPKMNSDPSSAHLCCPPMRGCQSCSVFSPLPARAAFCQLKREQIWIFPNETVKEWLLSSNPLCTQQGFYSGLICMAGRDKVWQRFSELICGATLAASYLSTSLYWTFLHFEIIGWVSSLNLDARHSNWTFSDASFVYEWFIFSETQRD